MKLLSVRDVADELAVSSETVLRWIRAGELRAIRLPGRMVRVEPDALAAFLEEHATAGAGGRAAPTARTDHARHDQPSGAARLRLPTAPPRTAATTGQED